MTEHYELLFIVSGSRDEKEIPEIKEKVISLITKSEGTITMDQDWDKRKLAYKIEHETYGHYWLLQFDMETANIKELSHQLQLMPEVLRFLMIKARVKTAADLKEEEEIKQKIRAKKTQAVKEELKEEEIKEQKKKKVETEIKKEEEKTDGKVSMEELDSKLDEILSDDIKI